MKSPAAESPDGVSTVTVLSVGPLGEDHLCLKDLLRCSDPALCANCIWKVEPSFTSRAALERLRAGVVPIVLCESDQDPDAWKEMLDWLSQLPDAPCLIVTSRQADDHLWVEALNLGAYDVLSKPFDRIEVLRVLRSAWENWKDRRPRAKAMAAA